MLWAEVCRNAYIPYCVSAVIYYRVSLIYEYVVVYMLSATCGRFEGRDTVSPSNLRSVLGRVYIMLFRQDLSH